MSGADKPKPRTRPTLAGAGLVMLGAGILLAAIAAITGSDSIFIWIDAGICFPLAATFLFLHLKVCKSKPVQRPSLAIGDSNAPHRWLNTALVLSALITIFSPAVKLVVDIGTRMLPDVAVKEKECRAVGPEGEARPY